MSPAELERLPGKGSGKYLCRMSNSVIWYPKRNKKRLLEHFNSSGLLESTQTHFTSLPRACEKGTECYLLGCCDKMTIRM